MILRIFISCACWFLVINTLSAQEYAGKPFSSLLLSVKHQVGHQPLVRNRLTYTNPSGEEFTISRFRYFLSNFSLETVNGTSVALPAAYFLVDEAVPDSKRIRLDSIPEGQYRSIRFLLGVDSARNTSGVQSGALAVESGMFWTWNSGYIMAQLEGHAAAAKSLLKEFVFHVGGYRQKDQVLRYITLQFPQPMTISAGKQPQIYMAADVEKWFLPDTISFKEVSVIMAPGIYAKKVAANYQHMFSITGIDH